MGILYKLVESLFEMILYVTLLFFERGQDSHEDTACICACVRDGTETDFSGNNCGPEISFGEIVFGRDLTLVHPMIEARSIVLKDVLNAPDSQMHGRSLYGGDDLGFDFGSLGIEFCIEDGLGSELHGRGKKRGHDTNKAIHFNGVREVFSQVLYFSQKMGIAVLEGTRGFVVSGITVHDKNAGQGFFA